MQKSIFFILLLLTIHVAGQEKPAIKFGKVSAEDFATKVYSIDSNAAAVVIADIGYSFFEPNENEWFSYYHKKQKRIHVLTKAGYEAANITVYLYTDGSYEDDLGSLKASTYNLENGKVVETKLEPRSVIKNRVNKHLIEKKFTMPNVREGSIIEYSYQVKTDYFHSPTPWYFQGEYPVLWSDLEFHIPEFFNYVFMAEGYHPYYNKQPPSSVSRTYNIIVKQPMQAGVGRTVTENVKLDSRIYAHRWVMKDVPALKEESFTSSLQNHISKIEFQLSEYKQPLTYRAIMQTWPMLTKALMDSELFGYHLDKANNWMNEDLQMVTSGAQNDLDKARRIYYYIRDNYTCTQYSAIFMDETLKNISRSKKGNVASINLLLVAMLKNAGIKADPVLLSTRSHGNTNALYPLLDKFNYIIARVELDGKKFFLDATRPLLPFGRILPLCYNGHARVINKEAEALEFRSEDLVEKKLSTANISTEENGTLIGMYQQSPDVIEAYYARHLIRDKGLDEYLKDVKKDYGIPLMELTKRADSLNKPEEPLVVYWEFKMDKPSEDLLFFNPMMGSGIRENPFKSAVRLYPVEMPYGIDEVYTFRMDIPQGYAVDEVPESVKVNLDEEGINFFEYIIKPSANFVSLRSRIKIGQCHFAPEDYEYLREFYSLIVKKHSEQIVFKKK